MPNWEPLSDIWNAYVADIETAETEGFLDNPEKIREILYPPKLLFGEGERDDIRQFVGERMEEILERVNRTKELDPNHIALYIFRSLVCGMLWEKERIGA